MQSLTHFWMCPQTRRASIAGRVGGNKEDDWFGGSIRQSQRSGLHGLSPQPAGPAPHEAFHWLASTVLAIFRVLSARFIYAMDPRPSPPHFLTSGCYPPYCRRPWTLREGRRELTFGCCTCSFPDSCAPGDTTEGRLQTPLADCR